MYRHYSMYGTSSFNIYASPYPLMEVPYSINGNIHFHFVLIGRFTRSEYLDTATLPDNKRYEEWHYKAIFVIADKLIGLYSDVMTVDMKRM